MQEALDHLKLGSLLRTGPDASPLPLEHTAVTGQITGPIASVSVTQTFGNPFKDIVELVYLFPLSHEAAVVDFEITIGSRTIHADMKELAAARKAYRDAIEAGQRAGLLEQNRPNLFSIQIGNVIPGEKLIAALRYQERLHYIDDHYEFVFPMGITPKFHADPAEAAKVDSPLSMPEERIGDVALTLAVDAGVHTGDPTSPSHTLQIIRRDEYRFSVSLPSGTIPNKDFVLRYAVAADKVQTAAWVSADADAETALITLLPPRLTRDVEPSPREFVFVIDRSGSMSGGPITQAKNALRACLRALGEHDTFLLQAFDDRLEWLSDKPQPVTQDSVNAADRWLNTIDARGGTDIIAAIRSALAIAPDPIRQRYVLFLTDGAVSADDKALAEIKHKRGTSRIFTFGIGPSVNRSLLAKMAEFGHGTAQFLQLTEDIEDAITRFQDRVSYPVLQDLKLEWHGLQAWDTYPSSLPDLYVGQPLELVTRLKREANGPGRVSLIISGSKAGQDQSFNVSLPAATESDPALRRVWARARVDALMEQATRDDNARQQVIGMAIEHRLLTPFTAFVAVDSEVVNQSGDAPRKVNVAVPLPEGLDLSGFVGGAPLSAIPAAPAAGAVLYKAMAAPASSPQASRGGGGLLRRISSGFGQAKAPDGSPNFSDRDSSTPMETLDLSQAIGPARLKWLARTQNVSGSWGSGPIEVEMTAAAVLAFVRAGHTTRTGNYRRQVSKAVNWLETVQATGFAAFARFRALAELTAAEDTDQTVPDGIQVGAATTDPERAALGDLSVTVPTAIKTLDDLRIATLAVGNVDGSQLNTLPIAETEKPLMQTWLSVGKRQS